MTCKIAFSFLIGAGLFLPCLSFAQAPEVSIAVTREIVLDATGQETSQSIEAGQIIAYDEVLGVYRLANEGDSAGELGVVVDDALLLFRTLEGVPVAHSGAVLVKVSTLGGPISAGDLITPSQIPGMGARAPAGVTDGLGIARESFAIATSSRLEEDAEGELSVAYGLIVVSLAASRFGAYETADIEQPIKQDEGDKEEGKRLVGIALFAVFLARLIAAAIITGGALLFAYRMYSKHVVAGIESVGRNPLAKTTIQGMVFLNMALIAVICAAAIALSIMIVILPI